MKIYKTQAEVDVDIKNNILKVGESVSFEFSLNVEAKLEIAGNIKAENIEAENIKAWNIEAGNIKAWNIEAENIKAWNIKAGNIKAGNIKAENIEAENIKAWNIEAENIKAGDISFWAVAFAYFSFKCKSIIGRRENSRYFCLDKEVEIVKKGRGNYKLKQKR